jgi:release factor glutamine methyltransferase
MRLQMIKELLINSGIEPNEANCEIKMLLEHFCHYTENDKIRGIAPDEVQLSTLEEKVRIRIKDRIPVQYIIGHAYFMGEYFKVTPNVLIPRDETEILVRNAIEIINKNQFKQILDIGTGSGCIACTIAKNTQATVLGVDISSDALRIALDNVTLLGLNNHAIFRKSNLFEKIREDEKFDLILSNPPYVPLGTELSPEVMHEPSIALFAEENGLYMYRNIIEKAPNYLNKGGYLMFELGINEAHSVENMLTNSGFKNIKIIKDLANIERVIFAQYM